MRTDLLLALVILLGVNGAATATDQCSFRVHPSLPTFTLYLNDQTYPNELEVLRGEQGYAFVQALEPEGGLEQLLPMVNRGAEQWLKTQDLDFDGYQDLLLLRSHSEEAGITHRLVWTYSPKSARFVYQPALSVESNIQPDPRARTLQTYYADAYGSPVFKRKVWRWSHGRPMCIRREDQSWDAGQRCYLRVVEELRGESWLQVERVCRAQPSK